MASRGEESDGESRTFVNPCIEIILDAGVADPPAVGDVVTVSGGLVERFDGQQIPGVVPVEVDAQIDAAGHGGLQRKAAVDARTPLERGVGHAGDRRSDQVIVVDVFVADVAAVGDHIVGAGGIDGAGGAVGGGQRQPVEPPGIPQEGFPGDVPGHGDAVEEGRAILRSEHRRTVEPRRSPHLVTVVERIVGLERAAGRTVVIPPRVGIRIEIVGLREGDVAHLVGGDAHAGIALHVVDAAEEVGRQRGAVGRTAALPGIGQGQTSVEGLRRRAGDAVTSGVGAGRCRGVAPRRRRDVGIRADLVAHVGEAAVEGESRPQIERQAHVVEDRIGLVAVERPERKLVERIFELPQIVVEAHRLEVSAAAVAGFEPGRRAGVVAERTEELRIGLNLVVGQFVGDAERLVAVLDVGADAENLPLRTAENPLVGGRNTSREGIFHMVVAAVDRDLVAVAEDRTGQLPRPVGIGSRLEILLHRSGASRRQPLALQQSEPLGCAHQMIRRQIGPLDDAVEAVADLHRPLDGFEGLHLHDAVGTADSIARQRGGVLADDDPPHVVDVHVEELPCIDQGSVDDVGRPCRLRALVPPPTFRAPKRHLSGTVERTGPLILLPGGADRRFIK